MKSMTRASIGTVRLKNRFIFPSMCNYFCDEDGFVTEKLIEYVKARVEGGAGAIIMPGSPHGKPGKARPALSDKKYYDGWKRLNAVCEAGDCRLFVQIHPAKMQAERDPSLLLPDQMPKELMQEIIESYAACAKAAKEIGLSGVEIHGAHAHEVAQFMSPHYNHRTDEYGGSTENRARLACEVIEAIKQKAGRDFPVIFRFSSDELIPDGRKPEESIEIAKILKRAGADALHVSIGMPLSAEYISAPMDVEDGFNLDSIRQIHDAVSIPVIAVNRINTPELAEKVIAEDWADFVAVGRGMLADPDFVNKAAQGIPVRKCLGCNQGCKASVTKKQIHCVQNPRTGREDELHIEKEEELAKKRILVIGAGPAGLEAAYVLAQRGAKPVVWEKTAQAGGLIRLAKLPPYKAAMERIVDWRMRALAEAGISVCCQKEADVASVRSFAPDIVILATGSEAAIPPIPGVENCMTADEALGMTETERGKIGKKCAVIGGGLVGVETADWLCEMDVACEIFEVGEKIGQGMNKNRMAFIRRRLAAHGCAVHVLSSVRKIDGDRIVYTENEEMREATGFDSVIVATGRKPLHALEMQLRKALPDTQIITVGDCETVGTAMDAITAAAQKMSAL